MARKLPWLSNTSKKPADKSGPPPVKRRRVQRSAEEGNEDAPHGWRKAASRGHRVRSSSPPPSPPEEELMREGLDEDEGWVQVEDEFLTTASKFTQHLHHAEYQRLKRLTHSRNENKIKNIERPTDGRTRLSIQSQKKREGNKLRERGRIAVTNLYGDGGGKSGSDDEADDPWTRDPRLAGLMATKDVHAPLGRIVGTTAKTRASEGFKESHKSPGKRTFVLADVGRSNSQRAHLDTLRQADMASAVKEEQSDLDDLNAPSYGVAKGSRNTATITREGSPVRSRSPHKLTNLPWKARERAKEKEKQNERPSRPKAVDTPVMDSDLDLDDLDPFPRRRYVPGKDKRVGARRVKKEEETRRQSTQADEIPTFMF